MVWHSSYSAVTQFKKISSGHPTKNEATLRLALRGHGLLAGEPESSVHG